MQTKKDVELEDYQLFGIWTIENITKMQDLMVGVLDFNLDPSVTKVKNLLEDQIIQNKEGDVKNIIPEDSEDDENNEIPELIETWEIKITPEENLDITELGLLDKHEKNFSIKEINEEIASKIESVYQINLLNIVILKPGLAPDSNTAIFKSIDIYLEDLGQDIIDLTCNAAIFERTKSYANENLSCRFILG
ncbi:21641_t:CDS:2 [Cetraspora pellucida]|uniref:21641_t:CDS:1 n=1 Tax=Cetraspora pellucida TaxID=1433469 RepID=A0A9N9HQT2_9GLOM|nr:21641_t:CDS:2 [Cetraspora pellucida]